MKYRLQFLHLCITVTVTAVGMILLFLWIQLEHSRTPITISTATDSEIPITISTASRSSNDTSVTISTVSDVNTPVTISTSSDISTPVATFMLTIRFGGQQGAGSNGLVSQQCFVSNLDIPAYIVEPFVISSILRHTDLNNRGINNLLKFSDMFNIDTFNKESKKSGYGPLVRWDFFINSAPDRAILVELDSGGQKGTQVVWDGHNTVESLCYKGSLYPGLKSLINITLCVVRIVRICCVRSDNRDRLSRSSTIMTTQELRKSMFGEWTSKHMTLVFQHWSAWWHVPQSCKHSIKGKIYPSEQIYKYANKYKNSFLKSNKIVAFVLRFEHLIARNYNVDVCLSKFCQVRENLNSTLTNASVFVAADLGKYQSGSWGRTFSLSRIGHKRGEQIKNTFVNVLSDFLDSLTPWTFEEWDNSFNQITGGIKDVGYIAALQKSIASTADCLVFLTKGESGFQKLVIEEYINYHPNQSEKCIHYLCTKDCPNCSHYYTKQLDM